MVVTQTELGDAGSNPGKSYLFFLTATLNKSDVHEIRSPGAMDIRLGKRGPCVTVRCVADGP